MSDVAFIQFKARHIREFDTQAAQVAELGLATPEVADYLEASAYSFSGLYEGECIGSAGVQRRWGGYGDAWALFGNIPRPSWTAITREVIRVLDEALQDDFSRIDTHILDGFSQGHRWARMLGFSMVRHPMRNWGPNGETYWLYERLRRD